MPREIPTVNEISALPWWAGIALAARCLRRARPLYMRPLQQVSETHSEAIERAIQEIELAAGSPPQDYSDALRSGTIHANIAAGQRISDARAAVQRAETAAAEANAKFAEAIASSTAMILAPVHAVVHVTTDVDPWYVGAIAYEDVPRAIHKVVATVSSAASEFAAAFRAAVHTDFRLLREHASRANWGQDTPVSPHFFSLCSDFVTNDSIIQVSSFVDAKLVAYFRQHPERIYSLTPRQFEELIAGLFYKFGYEVELTQRTRDGGRDVIAVSAGPVSTKHLIECKRWAATRSVGLAIVQRLHGVTQSDRATTGILVTTARRFTRPAELFLEDNKWVLEGKAFHDLLRWLDRYQEIQLKSTLAARERLADAVVTRGENTT